MNKKERSRSPCTILEMEGHGGAWRGMMATNHDGNGKMDDERSTAAGGATTRLRLE